jgi:hypothetical protein
VSTERGKQDAVKTALVLFQLRRQFSLNAAAVDAMPFPYFPILADASLKMASS